MWEAQAPSWIHFHRLLTWSPVRRWTHHNIKSQRPSKAPLMSPCLLATWFENFKPAKQVGDFPNLFKFSQTTCSGPEPQPPANQTKPTAQIYSRFPHPYIAPCLSHSQNPTAVNFFGSLIWEISWYSLFGFRIGSESMAEHTESADAKVEQSLMDKISEKIHDHHDSSSSSSDSDTEKPAAESSEKNKVFRLFGREKPVHHVFGGGKRKFTSTLSVWKLVFLLTGLLKPLVCSYSKLGFEENGLFGVLWSFCMLICDWIGTIYFFFL